jgi:hypothetical protein
MLYLPKVNVVTSEVEPVVHDNITLLRIELTPFSFGKLENNQLGTDKLNHVEIKATIQKGIEPLSCRLRQRSKSLSFHLSRRPWALPALASPSCAYTPHPSSDSKQSAESGISLRDRRRKERTIFSCLSYLDLATLPFLSSEPERLASGVHVRNFEMKRIPSPPIR